MRGGDEIEWRDIYFEENGIVYDYRGIYQVSNDGKVKSLNYNHTGKERILKEGKTKKGYLYVNLCKDGKKKNFRIHRLVAHLFIENNDPLNKIQVNHIDEDKNNNQINNLEWVTSKENNNHETRNKRSSEKMKGENNPMFNKHHSEETKQKMSDNQPNKKQVICINTEIVYPSSYEAERQTGVAQSSIIACCQGKYKPAGKLNGEKLVWAYYEEFFKEK